MTDEINTEYTPPSERTSTTAIVSLIAGIAGWTILPLIGSLVAVITGHMAKAEIREHAGQLGGDGLATAGLVLGYSSLALGLCLCILVVLGLLFFIPVAYNTYSLGELLALFV